MIDEKEKSQIVIEIIQKILAVEKESLNQLSRTEVSKLVDYISKEFEEVYTKYANNSDKN